MRVLLVRPGQQGEASARRLVLRGHAPLAAPLLTVRAIDAPPPLEVPDALLVTSQNAAQALAGEAGRLGSVPVYAVGAATARAVTRAGYATVHRSGGDGAALARQVAASLPRGARLLHVAGRDRRAEPQRSLDRAGFAVSVWEAYAAEPAPALPGIVAAALADGRLDAVLHYSRRSAETLVGLVHGAGLTQPLRALVHLCLSREVARGLDALSAPALEISREPTEEALFAALDRLAARPEASQARAGPAGDATQGTNPAARHSRTVKDDPPSMSETRRQDPLRRAPPTIDLKAQEVGAASAAATSAPSDAKGADAMKGADAVKGADAAKAAEEGTTAIEPVAATGLGSDPFPAKSAAPDAKAAVGSAPESPDAKPPAPSPAPTTSGGSSPASATKPSTSTAASKPTETASPKPTEASAVKPEPARPDAKPTATGTSSVPRTGGAGGTAAGAATSVAAAATGATPGRATTVPPASSAAKAPPPTLPDPAARAGDAAPPPPPRAKAGIGGLLTAGLLGGVAGAAVAAALMQTLPARTDTGMAERLAAVERRVSAAPTANPGTLEPRIAALETGLKQAGDDARAARTSAEAAARQASEAAARPLPAAATDPGLRPALDALSARVEESGKRAEANASAIRDLGTKLGEGLAAGTAAVAAVEASVRGIQTDLGTVKTSTGALDTRAAEAGRRLDALAGQMTGLSGDFAKLSPAASQAGLRLVVSGRLDEALRTGTPLGPVTAALERLGVEPGLLASLKPYAEFGAPTPAALAAAFKPLAAALTTEPVASAETVTEKVKRLVGKVVTVRAVGDGSGTDVPGLVARIEGALARGAVGEAAAAWAQFPESAKRATADWAESLKARAAAEDGARRIGAQSLAALDTVAASGTAARPAPSR